MKTTVKNSAVTKAIYVAVVANSIYKTSRLMKAAMETCMKGSLKITAVAIFNMLNTAYSENTYVQSPIYTVHHTQLRHNNKMLE